MTELSTMCIGRVLRLRRNTHLQPTLSCWLRASWERVHCSGHHALAGLKRVLLPKSETGCTLQQCDRLPGTQLTANFQQCIDKKLSEALSRLFRMQFQFCGFIIYCSWANRVFFLWLKFFIFSQNGWKCGPNVSRRISQFIWILIYLLGKSIFDPSIDNCWV